MVHTDLDAKKEYLRALKAMNSMAEKFNMSGEVVIVKVPHRLIIPFQTKKKRKYDPDAPILSELNRTEDEEEEKFEVSGNKLIDAKLEAGKDVFNDFFGVGKDYQHHELNCEEHDPDQYRLDATTFRVSAHVTMKEFKQQVIEYFVIPARIADNCYLYSQEGRFIDEERQNESFLRCLNDYQHDGARHEEKTIHDENLKKEESYRIVYFADGDFPHLFKEVRLK